MVLKSIMACHRAEIRANPAPLHSQLPLHHTAKLATEGKGVITEVHRSPVPQSVWHFGSGFLRAARFRSSPITATASTAARSCRSTTLATSRRPLRDV